MANSFMSYSIDSFYVHFTDFKNPNKKILIKKFEVISIEKSSLNYSMN